MAQNDATNTPSESEANRAIQQGGGAGQRDMDAQRDPNRDQSATSPETRSFEGDMDAPMEADRPSPDLGEGVPPNVDIHKLGQSDNPEESWGEPAGEGAVFSSNHTRRAVTTEGERGQGAKTRQHNRDAFSRRT